MLTNGQAGRWLVLRVLVEVGVGRFLVEDLGIATLAKCRQRHRAALEIMTIAGKWSEVHDILVKESCRYHIDTSHRLTQRLPRVQEEAAVAAGQ